MPNHVTNRIIFSADLAGRVRTECFRNDNFTFESLIPSPPYKYEGNLSAQDEKDFPCNWASWNKEHWGTKWDAYASSLVVEGDKAILTFDTAWNPPRPVIVAFANKYRCEFTFKSFDEGHNFWLIEEWGTKDRLSDSTDGPCYRMSNRYKLDEDKRALCIELKGYDPDDQDDE